MSLHPVTLDLLEGLSGGHAPPRGRVEHRPPPTGGPAPAFGPPPPARIDLGAALAERRSVRHYDPDPLDAAALGSALRAGRELDQRQHPQENAEGRALDALLVANRVDGWEAGAWWLDGDTGTVRRLEVQLGEDQSGLYLQQEFAEAPAVVTAVGRGTAAVAAHGVHGYRSLLTRGSAFLYAASVDGLRRGLGGCLFAGVLSDALRSQFGFDGARHLPLLALALGRPRPVTPARRYV